ncbi:CinA family nicotinamide mononucleotide deamidase-related protein [Thalassotalea agariperforans]
MKVQLLLTGNELMSGDIVDSNSAMIAQQLKAIGIEVKRKVTVSDDMSLLINEIKQISQQADVLIINGGLGPTTDDLTAEALANAANVDLSQHTDALAHIKTWCEARGAKLNEPNLKQTILPAGCDIIANSVGSAVGFKLTINHCDIYCTPGVPSELKVMLADEIIPALKKQLPADITSHTTRLQVFGYGESGLQKLLVEQFPNWPTSLEIGYRASMPLLELKITSRSHQDLQLKEQWLTKIKALLGDHIVSEIKDQPQSLAATLIDLLKKENKTLTTAESCTGGLISSLLTKEAGASAVFHAGFVTYSNEIKHSILGVSNSIIEQHGAVSEETVLAMAKGALAKSGSDLVIAVSGIAGPDGGTAEKPVGSFWLAWGDNSHLQSVYLQVKSNRWHFQQSVAAIGLDLIRRKIHGSTETPRYFIERKHQKAEN